MINAIAVEFENILCFEDRQRFEFANKGIHLITGKNLDFADEVSDDESAAANNGIGKSALATIIRFALFGYAKDTNKNILINKNIGKNLKVRFEFKIKDNFYVVERYKKHDKFKDELFLFKNNEDISASNKTQTQQDVVELLVISDDTFLKCSLFTREDNPQFLSLGLTERSKIFENIIHLSKFKKYLENVKTKKKSYTKYLSELDVELKSEQKNYTNLLTLFREQFYSIKEKRSDILESIKNCNNVSEELHIRYDAYLNTESVISSFQDKIIDLEQEIEDKKISKKKLEDDIKLINKKIKSIQEIIDDKIDHSKCENCGHITDTVNKQIEKLKLDIDKLEKTKPVIVDDLLSEPLIKERINKLKERLIVQEKKLESYNITNEDIKKIDSSKNTSKDIFLKQLSKENYQQCKLLIDKIRRTALNVNQLAAQKSDIQKTLVHCDKAIKLLDINEPESIKQHILTDIVPVFNNLLQDNVNFIYENKMIISFDSNLNETIVYKDEQFDFKELSTGEKTRLDLCISFSILELTRLYLGGFNVLFLDEVFSNIDEYFIIKFLKLINEKYQEDTAIYIISHSAGLRENANFESIVNLTMENKSSTFTIEYQ